MRTSIILTSLLMFNLLVNTYSDSNCCNLGWVQCCDYFWKIIITFNVIFKYKVNQNCINNVTHCFRDRAGWNMSLMYPTQRKIHFISAVYCNIRLYNIYSLSVSTNICTYVNCNMLHFWMLKLLHLSAPTVP